MLGRPRSPMRMNPRPFTYFGPKLSGGSKFKEKSHDVVVALLGGEEQGGGA